MAEYRHYAIPDEQWEDVRFVLDHSVHRFELANTMLTVACAVPEQPTSRHAR